ncbi:hypothetical protein IFM89_018661 [Coptis chinensis]|uniref:SUF system FeS cluster assembly SufBD core domain-containing protein n=1 Tax=Coptis chinensis TaxID=261450 RepID=A0A835I538_9MAGN|nr:hypothetical protein IFM89_018661 [Coptis chinensis]
MASCSTFTQLFLPNSPTPSFSKPRFKPIKATTTTSSLPLSDPLVLRIAETLEDSLTTTPLPSSSSLQKLRDTSSNSVLSLSWPSKKDEAFRFTDTSFIKTSQIKPVSTPSVKLPTDLAHTIFPKLVIIDGYIAGSERINELGSGVFVGSVNEIDCEVIKQRVFEFVSEFQDGDLFWSLNGIGTPDVSVVYVPKECRVEIPLHLMFYSSESEDVGSNVLPVSNPRVLVIVEEGGRLGLLRSILVEMGRGVIGLIGFGDVYWRRGKLRILLIHFGRDPMLLIQSGLLFVRHNLHVQQVGGETITELSFHLCLHEQTQDLHSRLVLDHPRGTSQQLHKCIVAHSSGQAVFDGNIKVNRFAQQTNAGQMTRTLLLEPRKNCKLEAQSPNHS